MVKWNSKDKAGKIHKHYRLSFIHMFYMFKKYKENITSQPHFEIEVGGVEKIRCLRCVRSLLRVNIHNMCPTGKFKHVFFFSKQ